MKILFLIASIVSLHAAPKAVVFDYGGVLTGEPDTKPAVSFLCESFGLSLEEYAAVNRDKKRALNEGKFDSEFWMEYAISHDVELPLNWHHLFLDSLRAAFPTNQEMVKLARELKQQVLVALFSNIDMRRAEFVRMWGDYDLFDTCILSYQIGVEKPHLRAYKILLDQLDLKGSDVVFIDDKLENVEAAKAAGIDAILFRDAEQIRRELHKRGLKGVIK